MLAYLALASHFSTHVLATATISDRVVRDVRLVHDIADLPPPSKLPAGLYLARIEADSTSGEETAIGPYIKAKTGELVEPPGSRYTIVVSGKIEVLSTISKPPPPFKEHHYRWEMSEGRTESEDVTYYSPFRRSGTVICGFDGDNVRSLQYAPVFLIPDEWAKTVAKSYGDSKTKAALFNHDIHAVNRLKLHHLVDGDDPIVGIFAAQRLCDAGGGDLTYVQQHWSDESGVRASAYLLCVLKNLPRSEIKRVASTLAARAASKADVHTSREILLAAVAGVLEPGTSPAFDAGSRILDSYKAAMVAQGHPYGGDVEVAQLLQLTGR